MTAIQGDKFFSLAWLGFSTKNPKASPPLPTPTPAAQTTLSQRLVSVGTSNSAKVALVGIGLLSAIVLSPTARFLTVNSPVLTFLTIIGYFALKLSQFIGGKLPLDALLNLLSVSKKVADEKQNANEGPQVEEVTEDPVETPASALTHTEYEKIWDQTQVQQKPASASGHALAEEFIKNETVVTMVEEFVQTDQGPTWANEFTQTSQAMVEEFVKSESRQEMTPSAKQRTSVVLGHLLPHDEDVKTIPVMNRQRAQIMLNQVRNQEVVRQKRAAPKLSAIEQRAQIERERLGARGFGGAKM